MKKALSVLLSILMVLSSTVFAVPALETVEDAAETAAVVAAEEAGELQDIGVKPGLNMLTQTTDLWTSEGVDSFSGVFTLSHSGKILDNPLSDSINSSAKVLGLTTKNNTGEVYPKLSFTAPQTMDEYRPVYVTFKYYKKYTPSAEESFSSNSSLWVMKGDNIAKSIGGFAEGAGWKMAATLVDFSNATKPGTSTVVPGDYTQIHIQTALKANTGTTMTYFDDVAFVPSYKISYMMNDGTDTVVAEKYFLFPDNDVTKTMYTAGSTYKPDTTVTPGARENYVFAGWSTNPDATAPDADLSITLANEDVKVYAVWNVDTSIRKGVRPGLNMATTNSNPWTFEGDTAFFKNFFSHSYGTAEIVENPVVDSVNGSSYVFSQTVTTSNTIYPTVQFTLTKELEKDRPIHVSFKYMKRYNKTADETPSNSSALWVMRNDANNIAYNIGGYNASDSWRSYSGLVDFSQAVVAGTSTKNPVPIKHILIEYCSPNNPGSYSYFLDDISFIPSYKISYMMNDGTDTEVDYRYALYADDDITKPVATSYTVDETIVPPARYKYDFVGWSTTPDGTTPATSVALANDDIKLYAIWDEDETLPDATTVGWDFETEESQTWGESYGVKYENGMMILDSTVRHNNEHYIDHATITDAETLNTGALRYLVVKARSLDTVSNIKFYFKTTEYGFTENNEVKTFVNIPLEANSSVFREYVVDMTANQWWTGDYKNCMLQLQTGSGVVEIEEIYFTTLYDIEEAPVYTYRFNLSSTTEFPDYTWGHTWRKNNGDGTLTLGSNANNYNVDKNGYVILYETSDKDANNKPVSPKVGYYDTVNDVYYNTSYEILDAKPEPGVPFAQNQGGFYLPNITSKAVAAENHPYLVIRGSQDTLTKIKSYYKTSESGGLHEDRTLTVSGVDFSDGYRYWIFDYTGKTGYTGNIGEFMMACSSKGTTVISDIYFTNTKPVDAVEEEVVIEKVYLNATSQTISEDHGTVTVSPYIRYTNGKTETDFTNVYYITDSVAAQVVKNADGTATVTGQMNGEVNITAVFPDGVTTLTKKITISNQADRIAANSFKVMMFGNSIRKHSPAPWKDANGNILETSEGAASGNGWTGNWGMAATSEDKDYAHRFVYYMDKKYGEGVTELLSSGTPAGFEAAAAACLEDEYTPDKFANYVDGFKSQVIKGQPDIVTIQLGENGGGAKSKNAYAKIMAQVVKGIQEAVPGVIVVMSTPFWSDDTAAKVIGTYEAAEECGIMVVPVNKLGKGAWSIANENMAFHHDFVAHASNGVKAHPGDTGMDRIAQMFFEKVNITLSANERTEYTTIPQSIEVTPNTDLAISEPYGKLQLTSTITPADAAQGVEWTVNNKDIGTVDENGLVSALNNGTLYVTATSKFVDTVAKTVAIEISGQTTPYTVTYDKNTTDEVSGMPEANNLAKENFVFDAVYPVRDTYKFLGWSLKSDGTEDDVITTCDITEDTTVYAVWEKAHRWDFERTDYQEEFTVENGFNEYVINGYFSTIATGTDVANGVVLKIKSPVLDLNASDYYALVLRMRSSEATDDATVEMTIKTTNGNVVFTKPIPSGEYHDYEFLMSGVTGTITGFEFKPANADTTIYLDKAEFATSPIFKYDANTSDETVAGMPAGVYDASLDEVTLSTDVPTRAGYKFLGWARTANSKLLIEEPVAISGDELTTVYAVWDRKDHWEMDSISEVNIGNADSYLIEDGTLAITENAGTDSVDITVHFNNSFGFNVDNSKKVVFRAKHDFVTSSGQDLFYWTSDTKANANVNGANGNYRVSGSSGYIHDEGTLKSDTYHDYTFDLTNAKYFSGTVNGFRFDPFQSVGTVTFDWVRFADSEANIVTAKNVTRKIFGDDWATHIVKKGGILAPDGATSIKNLYINGDIDMSAGYLTVTDTVEFGSDVPYAVFTVDAEAMGLDGMDYMYISGYSKPIDVADGNYIIKLTDGEGYVYFGSTEDVSKQAVYEVTSTVASKVETAPIKTYECSSIRVNVPESVRFKAAFSNAVISMSAETDGYEVTEYGFLVSNANKLDSAKALDLDAFTEGKAVKGIAYNGGKTRYFDKDDTYTYIMAVLNNVPKDKDAYMTTLYVRPYMVTSTGTVLYGNPVNKSLYDIATELITSFDESTNEYTYLNGIITTCNN